MACRAQSLLVWPIRLPGSAMQAIKQSRWTAVRSCDANPQCQSTRETHNRVSRNESDAHAGPQSRAAQLYGNAGYDVLTGGSLAKSSRAAPAPTCSLAAQAAKPTRTSLKTGATR